MADGNLITQCKHQDYVDETLCTIEILLDFFLSVPSDKHANAYMIRTYQTYMHMHTPTTLLLLDQLAVVHLY